MFNTIRTLFTDLVTGRHQAPAIDPLSDLAPSTTATMSVDEREACPVCLAAIHNKDLSKLERPAREHFETVTHSMLLEVNWSAGSVVASSPDCEFCGLPDPRRRAIIRCELIG